MFVSDVLDALTEEQQVALDRVRAALLPQGRPDTTAVPAVDKLPEFADADAE